MFEAIFNAFLTYFIYKLPKRKLIIAASITTIVFAVSFYFGKKKYEYRKERNTYNEMLEIEKDIIDYKNKKGELPNNLNVLIRNNPLKSNWLKDSWENDYSYTITNSEKHCFILKSYGKNLIDTEDDIVLIHNTN